MEVFWQIFAQVTLAILLAGAILVMSHLFGQRGRKQVLKDAPYECGIESKVVHGGPFGIKFYLVALLFVLFDVEMVLLLPWVLSFKHLAVLGPQGLIFGLTFILMMASGLFFEIKKGGLSWEK